MLKKIARLRRASRARAKIRELGMIRLCINRTPRHIYAQLIDSSGERVLACASTLEKDFKTSYVKLESDGKIGAAKFVGKRIAERAKELGIDRVAFDRSGLKYHGRVKALADAAREQGIQF